MFRARTSIVRPYLRIHRGADCDEAPRRPEPQACDVAAALLRPGAGRPPCLHPLADRDARARRGRRGASPGRPGPDCPSGPHRRRSDRPTGPLAGSRRSGHNDGTITTTPGRSDPRGALHWTSRDSHRGRRHNRPGQSERRWGFGLIDRSHLQGARVGQPLRGDLVSRDHLRTPRCSSVVRVIRCCASALSMRLSLPEGRSRREPQPARG